MGALEARVLQVSYCTSVMIQARLEDNMRSWLPVFRRLTSGSYWRIPGPQVLSHLPPHKIFWIMSFMAGNLKAPHFPVTQVKIIKYSLFLRPPSPSHTHSDLTPGSC
ncbi:hypothetical protein CRENBAI_003833 [Crenichthys baileyi]|uniref:Uncharacterized protein n=1 Tax=Crenichthys baileyi TaxID=28760 RepID=A0AAV9RNM8_9TELE